MEALAVLALAGCTRVRPRSRREPPIYSRIANTPFPENYATKESAAKLSNELFLSEGCSRICGHSLPSTSVHPGSLRRNLRQGHNVLPIWKPRFSAKTQVTTPNSEVIYAMH